MKIHKLICLDLDIIKKLKKVKNVSKLINGMLQDYFSVGDNLIKEKLKENITRLHKEIFDTNEKVYAMEEALRKVIDKEAEIKEIFKDIPQGILNDFKDFSLTERSLMNRYNDIYKKKYKVSWERVLKAFQYHIK